jgi:hypothetical protein
LPSITRIALISCFLIMLASPSRAEHKLLITDVLDKGQVEAEADTSYFYSENDFSGNFRNSQNGNAKHRVTLTDFSLRAGIASDIEIGISVPYVYSDRVAFSFTNPPGQPFYGRSEGWGDFTMGARYRLLGEDDHPFTLAAGMDIKLDTANVRKEGTGTTDYIPYLAASTTAANGRLRPFAYYRAVFRNHDANDDHFLGFGAEYKLNRNMSLVPFANVDFKTATKFIRAYEVFEFGMETYARLDRNLYLIPRVSFAAGTSTSTTSNSEDFSGLIGYSVGLGVYYLFN